MEWKSNSHSPYPLSFDGRPRANYRQISQRLCVRPGVDGGVSGFRAAGQAWARNRTDLDQAGVNYIPKLFCHSERILGTEGRQHRQKRDNTSGNYVRQPLKDVDRTGVLDTYFHI